MYVKGHQNNRQTENPAAPGPRPPPPDPVLKFLDPPLDMTNIGPKDVSLCRPAPPLLFNDPHKQLQKSSQRCIAH